MCIRDRRTSGALGFTMQVDEGEKYLMTKEELENKIATFTGGRVYLQNVLTTLKAVSYTHLDFRIRCCGCDHQIMVPRKLVEKNTKSIKKAE